MLLCAATLVIALHGAAHAQPSGTGPAAGDPAVPDEWERHPLSAELQLGINTPTGAAGVGVQWCPMSWLSLEGGVGFDRNLTLSDGGGAQFAVMSRLQHAVRGVALSFGVGASVGSYRVCDGCPFEAGDVWNWSSVYWVNTDIAIEYRWRLGLGLRFLFGGGRMLNPNDYTCTPHSIRCGPLRTDVGGTLYIGLGFVIPLTPAMR